MDPGPEYTRSAAEQAAARLFEMLLRVARGEAYRRRGQLRISGPELDDLAHQAAADAVVAFIGRSASSAARAFHYPGVQVRHLRGIQQDRAALLAPPVRPAGHRGLGAAAGSTRPVPAREYERRDLLRALRDAVERELTQRQRQVFVAIALHQVPLDALVAEQNSSRNAIYKTLFDARRKLRASLIANGYLHQQPAGRL